MQEKIKSILKETFIAASRSTIHKKITFVFTTDNLSKLVLGIMEKNRKQFTPKEQKDKEN